MSHERNDTLELSRAEREIVGIAVRKPRVWDEICHVVPEWFRTWQMQTIWSALRHCYEVNDGLAEPQVMLDWFKSHCGEMEIDGLVDLMMGCADEHIHCEFLDHYLALLEQAGSRLAVERWAGHVADMCRQGRSMSDIRRAVLSPPICERGQHELARRTS